MSHFAVLVVGNDVAKALDPFHEFECTGNDDEFVIDVDITEEIQKDYAENGNCHDGRFMPFVEWLDYWDGTKCVKSEAELDRDKVHKYQYAIVDDDGNLIKAVKHTNPDAKWDWWKEGGRFTKCWLQKSGEYGFNGLKKDFDLEGNKDADGKAAGERWDKVQKATNGLTWVPWKTVCEQNGVNEVSRKAYNDQPGVKAARKALDDFDEFADKLLVSREEYVNAARESANTLFAYIDLEGKWNERGNMGWWGCVSDEKDRSAWNETFSKFLDSLPDDAMLTIVDCHI